MKKHKLSSKLAAYSLAAGAAVVVANAATTQAVINHYESPVAPDAWDVWTTGDAYTDQDIISFKMDGTVVMNSADIVGLGILGQDDDTFTFNKQIMQWYGTDTKLGTMLTIGANVGYVGGWNPSPFGEWDVGRLGGGYEVGATLPIFYYDPDGIPGSGDEYSETRIWSDHAVTTTGGLGGWNFYFHGEWQFGGGGYIGLYADSGGDRFYGWADVHMAVWGGMRINSFAFETTPNLAILAGDEGSPGIPGDFTGEGDVNAADIDILCDNMSLPYDPLYDLDDGTGTGTPDSVVDDNDLIYHIEELVEWDNGVDTGLGTYQGDFNLDGVVNATDLAIMKSTFGTSGVGYADGNANCDDVVNATDLAILKGSFGFVAVPSPGGGVPEPATLTLLALGATGLMARRRRN